MSNNYIVYKHTNIYNNKVYIGITCKTPQKRWGSNGNGYRSNKHFWNAIQKYGWNTGFKHEILYSDVSCIFAENKEIELIEFYKSYLYKFGYNRDKGGISSKSHTKETKEKISKNQMKKIYCYNRYTGLFIKEYSSIIEVEKELEIPNADISACCKRKVKTAHDFIFRFSYDPLVKNKCQISNEELSIINYNNNCTPIQEFDADMNLINEYSKVKDVFEKYNYSKKGFYKYLKNGIGLYNGFYYKRKPKPNKKLEDFNSIEISHGEPFNVGKYSIIDGKIIEVYDNIYSAGLKNGIKPYNIYRACIEQRSSGGFEWRNYDKYKLDKIDIKNVKYSTKPVIQYTLEHEYVATYHSIKEAGDAMGCTASNISRALNGKAKMAKNFLWEFATEE